MARELEDLRLIKDINALKSKIKKRMATISKHYGVNADPILAFKELDVKSSMKGLNNAQLLHQKNLLRQFNEKQFTRLRGYEKYVEWRKDLSFGRDTDEDKKLWSIYNRYVEERAFADKYKYEILEFISEEITQDEETIHNKLEELFNKEINPDVEDITFSEKFKKRRTRRTRVRYPRNVDSRYKY